MADIYGKTFIDFMKQKSIRKYIYEMDIDLKLALKISGKTIVLG